MGRERKEQSQVIRPHRSRVLINGDGNILCHASLSPIATRASSQASPPGKQALQTSGPIVWIARGARQLLFCPIGRRTFSDIRTV
jgi:hypothetical protein